MPIAYAGLDAYVQKYIHPVLTDTIYDNSPVLTRLEARHREKFTGGVSIQEPIIVGRLNGGAFGRGTGFNIDFVTTDAAIVSTMRGYYVNISLYGWDSMINQGPFSVFSEVESKFQNAALGMAEFLGTNMWLDDAGARALHLTGFKQWIDWGVLYPTIGGQTRNDIMTVGTVGGLNAYTATLTSFLLQSLNTAYNAASFGSEHPDLIVCSRNASSLIWNALQPNQRYVQQKGSGVDVADAGFESFRFNGAEVVIDGYLPTGTNGVMYGLNTRYIHLWRSSNPKFDYGFTGFKETANSIDVAGQFLVASQITCPNPRTSFKLLSTLF